MNSESSPCEVTSVTLTAEPGWVTTTRGGKLESVSTGSCPARDGCSGAGYLLQ